VVGWEGWEGWGEDGGGAGGWCENGGVGGEWVGGWGREEGFWGEGMEERDPVRTRGAGF
jgi:hypothetical protein